MMIKTFVLSILTVLLIKGAMVIDQIDFTQVFMVLGVIVLLPFVLKLLKVFAAIMIIDPK